MFKIFITADVAKEAKEFLEKEFVVDMTLSLQEARQKSQKMSFMPLLI